MKSIKPGRNGSLVGGIAGVFMSIIGLTMLVQAIGSGVGFAVVFMIGWTAFAVIITASNFYNAFSKKRHSTYDIVDHYEEPDPLNERFGYVRDEEAPQRRTSREGDSSFCPYCGEKVEKDYEFCNHCGKQLP